MAWRNISGTLKDSYQIGTTGPTIYRGADIPLDANGSDGDLFVITDSTAIYSKIAGTWRLLGTGAATFSSETTYRGVPLTVSSGTDFVYVKRNPYTFDSIDITFDDINVTMDNNPENWTDIILPDGPEGSTVIVKDTTSKASMFNIYVEDTTADAIDGNVHIALTADGSDIELIYSGGYWRVISE